MSRISRYLEILAYMKTKGNRIVGIGSEDEWEILLNLASIGFDRRKSLFLFNTTEFNAIIKELYGFKEKISKCSTQQTNIIGIYSNEADELNGAENVITRPTTYETFTTSSSLTEIDQKQDNAHSQDSHDDTLAEVPENF